MTEVFITTNSKDVKPGWVFVAVRGQKHDGHSFLTDVVNRGASALIVEDASKVPAGFKGRVEVVKDARQKLAQLACERYNFPSREMFCVGVTGTNGKTSVTFMTEHFLTKAGMPVGVIGTVDHHLGNKIWPTEMTTPGPLELQQRLREFVIAGAKALSMEVSSHSLDQKRVEGIEFDSVIFTNLTRDHLDYHQTFEAYFEAKTKLFLECLLASTKKVKRAVVNTDDPWGQKLLALLKPHKGKFKIFTYGADALDANLFSHEHLAIQIISMDFSGTVFEISYKNTKHFFRWNLVGFHNVQNVVASIAALLDLKLDFKSIEKSVASFRGVPGRLERVPDADLHVLVDYAHSPDALENVLRTLFQIQQSTAADRQPEIWTLFGCGGDRDKGKRPQMAQVAQKYSQHIIVTSDNPRTEQPEQIIAEIKSGFSKLSNVHIEADRRKALEWVVQNAKKGDVILVAGKGHEDYQIIGTQKFPFSDQKILAEILARK